MGLIFLIFSSSNLHTTTGNFLITGHFRNVSLGEFYLEKIQKSFIFLYNLSPCMWLLWQNVIHYLQNFNFLYCWGLKRSHSFLVPQQSYGSGSIFKKIFLVWSLSDCMSQTDHNLWMIQVSSLSNLGDFWQLVTERHHHFTTGTQHRSYDGKPFYFSLNLFKIKDLNGKCLVPICHPECQQYLDFYTHRKPGQSPVSVQFCMNKIFCHFALANSNII